MDAKTKIMVCTVVGALFALLSCIPVWIGLYDYREALTTFLSLVVCFTLLTLIRGRNHRE